MSRFFFHVYDDDVSLDEEGQEMTLAEAREAALLAARALACEEVSHGHLDLRHRIEVTDESGASVAAVSFGEAVEIRH